MLRNLPWPSRRIAPFLLVAAFAGCGRESTVPTTSGETPRQGPPSPEATPAAPKPEPEKPPAELGGNQAPTPTTGEEKQAPEEEASQAPGRIRGTVYFDGTPPRRETIDMSIVAGCAEHDTPALTERLIVSDGKVANAFVYVSRGLDDSVVSEVPSEPLVIHQKGCVYMPHVAFARAGQRILVENNDGVTHNVNLKSQRNGEQNKAQAAGSPAMEFQFMENEVAISLACDYHPWMRSYVCVQDHPYCAVTLSDGSYTLEGLPPGKYTVSVWHEAFKTQRQELNVPAAGEVVHDFRFK